MGRHGTDLERLVNLAVSPLSHPPETVLVLPAIPVRKPWWTKELGELVLFADTVRGRSLAGERGWLGRRLGAVWIWCVGPTQRGRRVRRGRCRA